MTNEPKPETMLMSFPQLAIELRKRGIIDLSGRSVTRWAEVGVKATGGKPVRLRSQRIGKIRHSSVAWVREFLEKQE